MTQPEETTAALIARLHEQNRIANMELARLTHIGAQEAAERERLKCERDQARAERDEQIRGRAGFQQHCADSANKYAHELDEQRARTEKAEAELAHARSQNAGLLCTADRLRSERDQRGGEAEAFRQERDEARADFATVDRMLVERTREREEARESLGRVQADYQVLVLGTAHGAKCWMDECGWHCGDGCKAKHARKCVAAMERDQASEQLAVMTKQRDSLQWHNDQNYMRGKEAMLRMDGARSELQACREQLAKLEWVPGPRASQQCQLCDQIEPRVGKRAGFPAESIGHKPGCWFAKKGPDKTKTRPMFSMPDIPIDREMERLTADLHRHLKDHGIGSEYDVKASDDGLALIFTKRSATPARPEPRFKVGDRVWAHGKTHTIASSLWHALFSFWSHRMETGETVSDHDLKPAPKFAVGEWVTHKRGAGEVIKACSEDGSWIYNLSDVPQIGHWEDGLTAQTPQHNHDCKGCVFLGRMDAGDLYWTTTHYRDPGLLMVGRFGQQSFWPSYSNSTEPELIEARRRAVARGLVKS